MGEQTLTVVKSEPLPTLTVADAPQASAFPRDEQGRPSFQRSEDTPSDLGTMLGHLAHPQTLSDFASLLMVPVDEIRSAATRALAMTAAKAAPGAVKAGASATVDAVKSAATSANARKVAAEVVRNGATAAGAHLGGAPGAVMGSTVGEQLASWIRPAAAEVADEGPVSLPGYPRSTSTPPPPPSAPVSAAPAAAAADEFTAARTARQAVAPPDGPVVAASGKMQLTAPEFKEFNRLIKRMPLPDALDAVLNARALAKQLGGASPEEVAKAVGHMNRTGSW